MTIDLLLSKNKLEMCLYITSKDDVLVLFSEDGDDIAAQWSVLPGFLNVQGLGTGRKGFRQQICYCYLWAPVGWTHSSLCQSSSLELTRMLLHFLFNKPFVICELSAEMGKWMEAVLSFF